MKDNKEIQEKLFQIQQTPISEELQISSFHPVVKQIYANRGVKEVKEVDYRLRFLDHFSLLSDMETAVERLVKARPDEKVFVVGDYDVDGACAISIMVLGLEGLGFARPQFLIPDRVKDGYGVTIGICPKIIESGATLVITVDNGISGHEAIENLSKKGIDVIVLDHHLPSQEKGLPPAYAIVNPQKGHDAFPSKSLCGAGVAFYTLMALKERLIANGVLIERNSFNLYNLLEYVALATIADVVPLDTNNRILTSYGLKIIQQGKGCHGIRAALHEAGKEYRNTSSADLAFSLAPLINASGRLRSMKEGIKCLLSSTQEEAKSHAKALKQLLNERKKLEGEMLIAANLQIKEMSGGEKDSLPGVIVLYQENWHLGIIGLLASNIVNSTRRPAVVFTSSGGGLLRGSVRSVSEVNISGIFGKVVAKNPDLIISYGGHHMAAGLAIREEKLEEFSAAVRSEVEEHYSFKEFSERMLIDGELDEDDLSEEFFHELDNAGPWGPGFPEPFFKGHFRVINKKVVAGCHIILTLAYKSIRIQGILFYADRFGVLNNDLDAVEIIYRLSMNSYQGKRYIQLIINKIVSH